MPVMTDKRAHDRAEEEDATTEMRLACLASLLSEKVLIEIRSQVRSPDETIECLLLDYLLANDGNVEKAAREIEERQHRSGVSGVGLEAGIPSCPSEIAKPLSDLLETKLRSVAASSAPAERSVLPSPQATESPRKLKKPVLTLATPELVSKHTPCTLINSALPKELARSLYMRLQSESADWERNRWHLFDRQVTSPHTTAFYSEGVDEAASEWFYNAKQSRARSFTPEMNEARRLIKDIVNQELSSRKRFPLEYQAEWQPNVAAANCYRGAKENVGWHADQLTYLGPCPTIASLSLGVTRVFRLKGLNDQTLSIPLHHNTLLIMHAPVQEIYKHSIIAMRAIDLYDGRPDRFNMTFRFYRPDFASSDPANVVRCHCPIAKGSGERLPAVLRADMKAINGSDRPAQLVNERDDRPGKASLSSSVRQSSGLYFWMCNGGSQNEGKSCGFFKRLSETLEERGPFIGP